jgi:hypothetical protein
MKKAGWYPSCQLLEKLAKCNHVAKCSNQSVEISMSAAERSISAEETENEILSARTSAHPSMYSEENGSSVMKKLNLILCWLVAVAVHCSFIAIS